MKRMAAVLLAVALTLLLAPPQVRGEDFAFQVIVGDSSAVAALSAEEIGHLFLKKKTRWDSGAAVLPVDQTRSSRVREEFSGRILGKSVAAVESYWMQKVFSGAAVPPLEKSSDEDVVAYVRANAGAIGYVTKGAALTGVKAVTVR